MSLRGDVQWPARSPDLSPCNFLLWGYLREKVYRDQTKTKDDLKIAIDREIKNIPQEMTRNVIKSFRNRLSQCVANGDHHMNDVVLKK